MRGDADKGAAWSAMVNAWEDDPPKPDAPLDDVAEHIRDCGGLDEFAALALLDEVARLRSALADETEQARARLATETVRAEAAERANTCDACAGEGPADCMCGGTGKMSDAARYLRERLVAAERDALGKRHFEQRMYHLQDQMAAVEADAAALRVEMATAVEWLNAAADRASDVEQERDELADLAEAVEKHIHIAEDDEWTDAIRRAGEDQRGYLQGRSMDTDVAIGRMMQVEEDAAALRAALAALIAATQQHITGPHREPVGTNCAVCHYAYPPGALHGGRCEAVNASEVLQSGTAGRALLAERDALRAVVGMVPMFRLGRGRALSRYVDTWSCERYGTTFHTGTLADCLAAALADGCDPAKVEALKVALEPKP